jgi:hypothetical protein
MVSVHKVYCLENKFVGVPKKHYFYAYKLQQKQNNDKDFSQGQ